MRKQLSRLSVMAALVLTAAVHADAQYAPVLTASIPFNFVVKDRTLPAGEYTIAAVRSGSFQTLRLQSRDGHITVIVLAQLARDQSKRVEPNLLFNRFGDEYFLTQVTGLDEKAAYSLAKSRAEHELAKSLGGTRGSSVSITPTRTSANRPQHRAK